jgi:hypothetical protein
MYRNVDLSYHNISDTGFDIDGGGDEDDNKAVQRYVNGKNVYTFLSPPCPYSFTFPFSIFLLLLSLSFRKRGETEKFRGPFMRRCAIWKIPLYFLLLLLSLPSLPHSLFTLSFSLPRSPVPSLFPLILFLFFLFEEEV